MYKENPVPVDPTGILRQDLETALLYNNRAFFRQALGTGGSLVRTGGDGEQESYDSPAADKIPTEESRWRLVLKPALQQARTGDVIVLNNGRFALPYNQSMKQWLRPGVRDVKVIHSGSKSAIIYGLTYERAGDDSLLYTGVRNPVNFGADPTQTVDSWLAFMATRYSLPPFGSGAMTEAEPGIGAYNAVIANGPLQLIPDVVLRRGAVAIPQGGYLFSRPFYRQGWQDWREEEGTYVMHWMANIAPSGGPNPAPVNGVFAYGILRSINGGAAQSNFTHNAKFSGAIMACDPVGNERLRLGYLNGAQNSEFKNLECAANVLNGVPGGFAGGFYVGPYSCFCAFNEINLNGITGTLGPGLHLNQCNSITGESISIQTCNQSGTALDAEGGRVGAMRLDACDGIQLPGILNFEGCPRGLVSYGSQGVSVGSVEVSNTIRVSGAPLTGTVAVDIWDGFVPYGAHTFDAISGDNVQMNVRLNGVMKSPGDPTPQYNTKIHTNYATQKNITKLSTELVRFEGFATGMQFVREEWAFVQQNHQGEQNPAVILTSSATDGTGLVDHSNFARNNGLEWTGYYNQFCDGYFNGPVNTVTNYRVDGIPVVGPQGAAVANATDAASAITQLNLLLARCRAHGLIAP